MSQCSAFLPVSHYVTLAMTSLNYASFKMLKLTPSLTSTLSPSLPLFPPPSLQPCLPASHPPSILPLPLCLERSFRVDMCLVAIIIIIVIIVIIIIITFLCWECYMWIASHVVASLQHWFRGIWSVKDAWSKFFNIKFSVSFEESSLQKCVFKISVETVRPFGCTKQFCILQLPIILL